MALRNQPYFPLYVQDFLTDEKLMECSVIAHGVYIRLLCVMHKSDEYGCILLRQKDRQSERQIENFALKLIKFMPFSVNQIESGLSELLTEGVITLEGDKLFQKRMVKDNSISVLRSNIGKKGGESLQSKLKNKDTFAKAKEEANSEYEYENESAVENTLLKKVQEKEIHKFNAFIKEKFPTVWKLQTMTDEQCDLITSQYPKELILSKLESMENKKDLLKKYKSCYLTLNNWIKTELKSKPKEKLEKLADALSESLQNDTFSFSHIIKPNTHGLHD